MYAPDRPLRAERDRVPALQEQPAQLSQQHLGLHRLRVRDIAAAKHHVHPDVHLHNPRAGVKIAQCPIDASKARCSLPRAGRCGGSQGVPLRSAARLRRPESAWFRQPANILRVAFQRLDLRKPPEDHRGGRPGRLRGIPRTSPTRCSGLHPIGAFRAVGGRFAPDRGPAVYALYRAVFLRDWMLDSDEAIGASTSTSRPSRSTLSIRALSSHPFGTGRAPDAIHQAIPRPSTAPAMNWS